MPYMKLLLMANGAGIFHYCKLLVEVEMRIHLLCPVDISTTISIFHSMLTLASHWKNAQVQVMHFIFEFILNGI